jgi:cytochrome c-type protein NapC
MTEQRKKGFLRRYSPLTILIVGGILGVIFWGGFNTAMEATNTEVFCVSCHEMYENVYLEYQDTIHYNNRTGVRATCPDCHVPKDWVHKFVRKIKATNELYHKAVGSIDTPEKFEAKRLELARHVWESMKATDSRECRNCHDFESMDYTKQGRRGMQQHIDGADKGLTCIDCHKGIAHSLPDMSEVDSSAVLAVKPEEE